MKNNTVSISLVGVAFMAALLLTASESHAKKPMNDDTPKMDHHHAEHSKESGKTPQQQDAAGLLKKGNALRKAGKYEEALSVYTKAITFDPKLAEAYFQRGMAFYRLGGDLSAIEDFSKAIELNPNYMEAHFQRGAVWFRIGNEEKMIEDFKSAARLGGVDHQTHEHVLK